MESEGLSIKFEGLKLEEENVRKCIYILGTGLAPPHICVWVCTNRYTHICGGQRSTSYATPMCVHVCECTCTGTLSHVEARGVYTRVWVHTHVHSYMWRSEVNLIALPHVCVYTHVCECVRTGALIHVESWGQPCTFLPHPHVCTHIYECTHTGTLIHVQTRGHPHMPFPMCVYTHVCECIHTSTLIHVEPEVNLICPPLVCVYTHVCECTHTSTLIHVEARGQPRMPFPIILHLFWHRFFYWTWSETIVWTGWPAWPRILLSPRPPHHHFTFLHRLWRL